MDYRDQIKKFFKGEILDDAPTLDTYSHDASLFTIKPTLILCPQDPTDIENLVKFVSQNKDNHLSITPRSAGTDMSGGAINDSLILDLNKHFTKIIQVDQGSATTQPGVFYRDFEKETLQHNLLLPCYPASRELCTVGGMVANNSAGEKTLFYGQTHDFVEKLKVVLADGKEYLIEPLDKEGLDKKMTQKDFEGELYRQLYKLVEENYDEIKAARPQVHKNSAGYLLWDVWDRKTFDLTQLITGSQGTLGIVTEIKFRLIKPKNHSKLLVSFLYNLDNLAEIVNTVLKFQPETFESYDDYTLKVAMRFLPEMLKVMGAKNILSLAWQFLPEFWMTITGGLPKLVLLAEFTGDTLEEVEEKCQQAQAALAPFNLKTRITKDEQEAKKYLTVRHESFNLLRHHSGNLRTAPFIDDLIVKPEYLPEFLPKLRRILDEYKITYTIAGHIGDGNFHIIPLMDFNNPKTLEIIDELGHKVYDLIFAYHGSMTAEHNDGLIRGPYLQQMYGEKIYQLFKEVKKIFDPESIFNPHKKADATFEYQSEHIITSS